MSGLKQNTFAMSNVECLWESGRELLSQVAVRPIRRVDEALLKRNEVEEERLVQWTLLLGPEVHFGTACVGGDKGVDG